MSNYLGKVYVGLFLDDASRELLLQTFRPVHPNVFAHHITFAFGRHMKDEYPIGKRMDVTTLADFCDNRGQCLTIHKTPELISLLWEKQVPHVTVSCADGVKPVYSNELLNTVSSMIQHKAITLSGVIDYFPRTDPVALPRHQKITETGLHSLSYEPCAECGSVKGCALYAEMILKKCRNGLDMEAALKEVNREIDETQLKLREVMK